MMEREPERIPEKQAHHRLNSHFQHVYTSSSVTDFLAIAKLKAEQRKRLGGAK